MRERPGGCLWRAPISRRRVRLPIARAGAGGCGTSRATSRHGRIFNALTRLGTDRQGGLSIRLSEERAGLRIPRCRRKVRRDVAGRSEQAYISLEDTTEGRIALVVRADHPALRSRCNPAFALPTAHVRPAPAGVVLRRARALSLAWQDPIRLEDGRLVGSVAVRVRLVVVPPPRVAAALRRRT